MSGYINSTSTPSSPFALNCTWYSSPSASPSTGAIVGGVVGGAAFLLLLLILLLVIVKARKKHVATQRVHDAPDTPATIDRAKANETYADPRAPPSSTA